jgi:iron-sulfur cluster repair protein YtfE (RIC family)
MSENRCQVSDMTNPVEQGLADWFTRNHRSCDDLWAHVETAVDKGIEAEIISATVQFVAETKRHLQIEEELLFPMLGQATGMGSSGPVGVMLAEHEQMKRLLNLMEEMGHKGDGELVLDLGDTLLLLTQQHNMKEEQILYPMSEEALSGQWPELHARLLKS